MSRRRRKRRARQQETTPPSPRAARNERPSTAEVDAALVRSIVRWSLIVAAAMALYAVGVFAGYPYPDAIEGTRAPFYIIVGVVLTIAAAFITFLGYRLVSMRVIRQGRTLYLVWLPGVMFLSVLIAILLIAAPN